MKIRVDHKELLNVTNKLKNESSTLLEEIEKIEKNIADLKTNWQGEEAEVFYNKIDNYLIKLKTVPVTYSSMADFLNHANIRYKEADQNLKNEFDNVRMNG